MMKESKYMEHTMDLFAKGQVDEEVFWCMVDNAPEFSEPDDYDELPQSGEDLHDMMKYYGMM